MLYLYQGGITYSEAINMTIPELLEFMEHAEYIYNKLNKEPKG